jgi:signal transduction histidine kinase
MSAELPAPDLTVDHDPGTGSRWIGWRLRLLVAGALLGCVGLFVLARALALEPAVPASWRDDGHGRIELTGASDPALAVRSGRGLTAIGTPTGGLETVDGLLLQHSTRWLVADGDRTRQARMDEALRQARASGAVDLHFDDGSRESVVLHPRGVSRLGLLFWLLAALSLMLYLTGLVTALAQASARPWPYVALVWAQAANLLFIAIESVPGLGQPLGALALAPAWRLAPDLATAAAVVHAAALHPRRLPNARWIVGAAWGIALLLLATLSAGALAGQWWWLQGSLVASGLAAIALLTWNQRRQPHPLAPVLRRFGAAAVGTLVMLTLVIAVVDARGDLPLQVARVGSVIWTVFLASLLLTLPMLTRAQPLLREFSLVAGVSTVATSLDLLFVALFSLGQFESLALALFVALGAYAAARQWVMSQLLGRRMLTAEHLFEQLYRAARDVESDPRRVDDRSRQLLGELFDPIEVGAAPTVPSASRVVGSGAGLVVPLPATGPDGTSTPTAVWLRHAQRGQRLFTAEDARLADHAIEQLQRVLAVDVAVEQGRREERLRLAQDLHDDIGARLLTLMYQAPNREMEDYVRHTLQDLKTLTRGLSASSHRLSDAAAEWKSDLGQRLQAAHCTLGWSFAAEHDPELGVVQWSALTRLLRELVTNVIAHAHAAQVEIEISHDHAGLRLVVSDDGCGRDPLHWAPGLGLGGIRKRVRQLGGTVQWAEREPRGICCTVRLPLLGEARA